ncbi:MAG TPA: ATP-dependent RecD-like DNA helicase [Caldilineae bacterium]|nr:ATP-dependent RecD-like DNA helicase [Caldilineae bacterium]
MIELTGVIERITYHNEESGYTVAQLTPEGKNYTVTVVGNMLGVHVGESVRVTGQWVLHPQYGRQFKAESVRTVLPATVEGIRKYLGSGLIKGIGPITAERIVRHFGLETLDVIEEDPERLLEVPGVGPKRVAMIQRAWEEQRQIKEVMLFLQANGVSTSLAVKIYKTYGDSAIAVVRNDPYRLARDIHGIGFITADKIARNLGIAPDDPGRAAAGVAYVLSQKADEGHVYVPRQELVAEAARLLEIDEVRVNQAIEALALDEQVHVESLQDLRTPVQADPDARPPQVVRESEPIWASEEQAVYLTPFYYGEIGVVGRLKRLIEASVDRLSPFLSFDWTAAFEAIQRQTGLALAPAQRQAVQTALTQRVAVLTGGPGTGKTTTVQTVIRMLEAVGRSYVLASPTGRAAKRLTEATGREAKTVHRLLGFKPGEGMSFQHDEENPLDVDMVIVDEASMLDLLLTNHLLKAIPPGAHLLLVGDVDQLPSVGAGNVLRDIIASDVVAVVRLETIFRQEEGSYIIVNAHRINQGQMPILDNRKARDFFLFRTDDPERAAELVVELVQTRIPRRFGLSPSDIQVLSPMHRGEAGVGNLNLLLQEAINPPSERKPERRVGGRVFRLGDRVMQVRNNYDKEVYNGDLGHIVAMDLEDQTLVVDFDGRRVMYDFLELDELVHAYAISVHKAQGSEFPAVVVPVLTQHYVMLQRNLLYTAVTRARQLVVLVGTPRAIAIAVRNDRVAQRYSALAERLRNL